MLDLFTFENLAQVPGVVHAISTRSGGVSDGRCATLNTSFTVGDTEEHVEENLRRLAEAVGTERASLFWAYQVHGNAVTVVEPDPPPRPRCDVLVTNLPEKTL